MMKMYRWRSCRVRLCVLLLFALSQRLAVADRRGDRSHPGNLEQEQINWETRRSRGMKELRLGMELRGEVVKYGEDTARYKLVGLNPSASYEVKLSYPGISHAKVSIRFGGKRAVPRGKGGRRLLDVEKLEFATGGDGLVRVSVGDAAGDSGAGQPGTASREPIVLVSARQRAPHVHGNDARGAYLVYDVALSEVRMGLPLEAAALVPFLGVLVVLVVIAAFCVAPVGGLEGHPAARWQRARQMQQEAKGN